MNEQTEQEHVNTPTLDDNKECCGTCKFFDDEPDLRPVHIYFMKKDPGMFNTKDVNNLRANLPRRIVYATSWSQIAEIFQHKPETICVNASHFENTSIFEITNMIDTFARLVGMTQEVSITIGVHKDTTYKLIKEAQKSRICGLIPAAEDFGLEETVKGVQAQWSKIPYWPKHILNEMPGAPSSTSIPSKEIVLTGRQQQVFDLIVSRGCSNKHIAKMMNISESTVKLHMSAILKKYGVKNRTQLAVFAKSS